MTKALTALLWDVDGTLAETERDGHRVAFNRCFAEAGLPWRWDPATYLRLLAVSGGRERMASFLEAVEGRPPTSERLEALQRRKQVLYARMVEQGAIGLRAGVSRLIGELATAGVRQAIVTTSGRCAVEALTRGLLGDQRDAFEFWICGEDVKAKKPDPEAYRQALDRLGVAADRVLALEDSPQGLAAATAAGLSCVVTLSWASRQEPIGLFDGADAVVDGLGDGRTAVTVHRGPPCPDGSVTLSWLHSLLNMP